MFSICLLKVLNFNNSTQTVKPIQRSLGISEPSAISYFMVFRVCLLVECDATLAMAMLIRDFSS